MILEAKNVEYAYKIPKGKEVPLEWNFGVVWGKKKFYTIIGASGAGKTTLSLCWQGLGNSPKGKLVLYEGEDILTKGLNYHRKESCILSFQEYNLIDYLTTEENVKLGRKQISRGGTASKVNIPKEAWKRNVMEAVW